MTKQPDNTQPEPEQPVFSAPADVSQDEQDSEQDSGDGQPITTTSGAVQQHKLPDTDQAADTATDAATDDSEDDAPQQGKHARD